MTNGHATNDERAGKPATIAGSGSIPSPEPAVTTGPTGGTGPTARSGPWTRFGRYLVRLVVPILSLAVAPGLAVAHDPAAPVPIPDPVAGLGLGFGLVVGLTVTLGVLGGVVARRPSATTNRLSTLGVAALLVALGGWAVVVALLAGPALVAVIVAAGAAVTWRLRHRVVGGHRGCDQVALGSVLLHRFVEGALLATLYSSAAVVGIGAAVVLGVHSAAETGAVAGLWTTIHGPAASAAHEPVGTEQAGHESVGRGGWLVIAAVQGVFVVGALGGGFVSGLLTPSISASVVALLGGALIAAGVATAIGRRRGTAA